jgi:hypothetical protein
MRSVVVYTAITQGYDCLRPIEHAAAVAYCEVAADGARGWTRRELMTALPVECRGLDPNRRAKWFKLHPHCLFPDHDVSIWIDGSVALRAPLERWVPELRAPWAVFPHHARRCILEEAAACGAAAKDDPVRMFRQVARYFAEGYPRHHGLAENTIIVRRHADPTVIQVARRWWREIVDQSPRDQLSFDYCCWKEGFRYQRLPGTVWENPLFEVAPHRS